MSTDTSSVAVIYRKTLRTIAVEKTAICILYFAIGVLSRPWVEELVRRYL
jgi:hypothetical protein